MKLLRFPVCLLPLAIPLCAQSGPPEPVAASQHEPVALTFTASREHPWRTFPVQAIFTQGARRLELDAFWDGGRTWRVRFAAPTPGEWNYTLTSTDPALHARTGTVRAAAPSAAQLARNPNLRGQVRATGHHFAYADATPVLLLGDCQLFGGLGFDNGDFTRCLEHRRAAGFNALNVRLCKRGAKNEGGPIYASSNVEGLNPRYFGVVDRQMQAAWERGFVVFFMPDFLGTGGYDQADVQDLWRYLLARYGAFNVCPIVTGEYDNPRRLVPFWKDKARWIEVGHFLHALNRRGLEVPVGTHPVLGSSGADFHDQPWLDYNQIQAKVWKDFDTAPISILEDYARTPAKPTFYAEGTYENQPWGGIVGTALHVRHQTWVGYLCGAAAVDYGEFLLKPGRPKGQSLDSLLAMPGARQAADAANLLRRLEWWRMAPQREAVLVDGVVPPLTERKANTPLPYCLAETGKTYVVYLMAGLEKKDLTLTGLGPAAYVAQWIDPRTFAATPVADGRPARADAAGRWPLPPRPAPAADDWVLLLRVAPGAR
jgi:hypothetical protein